MIILDYKDTRPIYEQIVDKMQTLILKGVLKPDEQLQSVRSLAMELSVNPNTIQKAYTELERQGFVYTVKGRGAFVRYEQDLMNLKEQEILFKIEEILKEANELGFARKEILMTLIKREED